jgi:hypothetical protein
MKAGEAHKASPLLNGDDMTEAKKRGPKPKAPQVVAAEFVEVPTGLFRNMRKGVIDLKGVIFQADEVKALTDEQQAQIYVKRAIELGMLKAE